MLALAIQLTARLRQVLLVAALALGSVTGLLLAHSDDTHHAVEAVASAPAHAHDDAASATWWLGQAAGADEAAPGSSPTGDALAFCLTLASCIAAILLALFGLRRLPAQWRVLSHSVADPPHPAGPRSASLPQPQHLLCVYRI